MPAPPSSKAQETIKNWSSAKSTGTVKTGSKPASTWGQETRTPIPRQNPLSDTSRFSGGRERLAGVNQGAISRLVAAQEKFNRPLNITSGYRDPAHNLRAGGAKRSQHIHGNAIDLSFADDPRGTQAADLIRAGKLSGFGGVGGYRPGKVHFDIGAPRQWGANYRRSSIGSLPPAMQLALNTPVAPRPPANYDESPLYNPVALRQPRPVQQFASARPMSAPPTPQVATAPSLLERGKNMVKAGYDAFTGANKKINAVGGPDRAVALSRLFGGAGNGYRTADLNARRNARGGGGPGYFFTPTLTPPKRKRIKRQPIMMGYNGQSPIA